MYYAGAFGNQQYSAPIVLPLLDGSGIVRDGPVADGGVGGFVTDRYEKDLAFEDLKGARVEAMWGKGAGGEIGGFGRGIDM